jgi:hypothetical protein
MRFVRPGFSLLLIAALLGSSECATVEPLGASAREPEPLSRAIGERLCYDAGPVENTLSLQQKKRRYRIYDVTLAPGFDGSDDDSPITLEFYEPRGVDSAPVILVLPVLNGHRSVSCSASRSCCSAPGTCTRPVSLSVNVPARQPAELRQQYFRRARSHRAGHDTR